MVLAFALSAGITGAEVLDFATLLQDRPSLWELSRRQIESLPIGQEARANAPRQSLRFLSPLRFGDLIVPQSELLFSESRPQRWEGLLYDRALHGQISSGLLQDTIRDATNAVTRWTGTSPMYMDRPDGSSAWVWGNAPHIVSLEWIPGGSEAPSFSTECLRLVAEPWPPRNDWAGRIRQSDEGDRVLEVPMVDQEVQGFCAPATMERLMRYYGVPLAASDMSRLAASTPDAGTNVQRMLEELARMQGLGCQIREHLGFDVKRFDRLLESYNREAGRQGKPALTYSPPVLDLAAVFAAANPDILRKVTSGDAGRTVFWEDVRKSVEGGHPLLWGVVLGIVAEPGIAAQTRGGHLRLIVGYHEEREEILYSDSWGPGHECKRMRLQDAWATTMTLHSIVPPERVAEMESRKAEKGYPASGVLRPASGGGGNSTEK